MGIASPRLNRRKLKEWVFKMTTVKFLKKDEALAAIIRALATKSAGFGTASGATDEALQQNGFYTFKFDSNQYRTFLEYVGRYVPERFQEVVEITHENSNMFKGF